MDVSFSLAARTGLRSSDCNVLGIWTQSFWPSDLWVRALLPVPSPFPGRKDCVAWTRVSVIMNALYVWMHAMQCPFTAWYPVILTSWQVSFSPAGLWGGRLGCGPSILSWAFPSVSNTEEIQKHVNVVIHCVSFCACIGYSTHLIAAPSIRKGWS